MAFPSSQGLEASKAQRYKWGVYCSTNWRCTASIVQTSCTRWGVPERCPVFLPKATFRNRDSNQQTIRSYQVVLMGDAQSRRKRNLPTSGPTSGSTSGPTSPPTRADFPVFSPARTPHESSHESVHRRAHEWTVGVHLSCFHLFCSLTN